MIKSYTFEPFWNLSLPLPPAKRKGEVSLYDCIFEYTREEKLTGRNRPVFKLYNFSFNYNYNRYAIIAIVHNKIVLNQ